MEKLQLLSDKAIIFGTFSLKNFIDVTPCILNTGSLFSAIPFIDLPEEKITEFRRLEWHRQKSLDGKIIYGIDMEIPEYEIVVPTGYRPFILSDKSFFVFNCKETKQHLQVLGMDFISKNRKLVIDFVGGVVQFWDNKNNEWNFELPYEFVGGYMYVKMTMFFPDDLSMPTIGFFLNTGSSGSYIRPSLFCQHYQHVNDILYGVQAISVKTNTKLGLFENKSTNCNWLGMDFLRQFRKILIDNDKQVIKFNK